MENGILHGHGVAACLNQLAGNFTSKPVFDDLFSGHMTIIRF